MVPPLITKKGERAQLCQGAIKAVKGSRLPQPGDSPPHPDLSATLAQSLTAWASPPLPSPAPDTEPRLGSALAWKRHPRPQGSVPMTLESPWDAGNAGQKAAALTGPTAWTPAQQAVNVGQQVAPCTSLRPFPPLKSGGQRQLRGDVGKAGASKTV